MNGLKVNTVLFQSGPTDSCHPERQPSINCPTTWVYFIEPGPGNKVVKVRGSSRKQDRSVFIGDLQGFRNLITHLCGLGRAAEGFERFDYGAEELDEFGAREMGSEHGNEYPDPRLPTMLLWLEFYLRRIIENLFEQG